MKRMKLRTLTRAVIMSLVLSVSCTDGAEDAETANGVAKPDDQGEPIWTLHAALEGDPVTAEGDVRLAFMWRSPARPLIAEDIAVASQSMISVDIKIYELPNESILTSSDETVPPQLFTWEYSGTQEHPTVHWAQGKLVLYEDINGNGELDLLADGATETIDRVVGGAFNNDFYYIESDLEHPFAEAPEVTRGLTMVSLLEDPSERKPVSLEDDIPLTLDDSLDVQRHMCNQILEKHWIDGEHLLAPKACTAVPPNELLSQFPNGISPEIDGNCADSGFIFEWYDTMIKDNALCSLFWYTHGDYNMSRLSTDEPIPEYWPCEVDSENYTPGDYPQFVNQMALGDEIGVFDETAIDACVELTADLISHMQDQME